MDWTSPQNDELWRDGTKTLFDPCPAGWRVPGGGTGKLNLWTNFWIDIQDPIFTESNANPATYAAGPEAGYHYYCFGNSGITAWYPAAGGLNFSDGTLWIIGSWGMYWLSYNSQHAGASMHLSFRSTYPDNAYYRSYGISVRCIRE
ncbi:hypothetical protein [uncultured Rikenella sp.]|uniref:hypothetical protein n=1 Tax=uncultured Rikenella sp. TaxID=368003 RepID=UPI002618808C|nr:hypothetical protein [uncultured Rikenella sp.]